MIDINAILSTAVKAAVDEQLTELKQQYANAMGELLTRIAKLEADSITQDRLSDWVDRQIEQKMSGYETGPATELSDELEEWVRDEVKHIIRNADISIDP